MLGHQVGNALLTAILVLLPLASTALGEQTAAGEAVRTGKFRVTFTLAEVAGADSARVVETFMSSDEPITWEVYVPDSYQPETPAGLMVYVSPSSSGELPRGWKPIMDERNLIWVAARHSGNRVRVARRALYALVAPTWAGRLYTIDQERIYLSGFSGGGKVASMVAVDYAQLFKGAIYNCGVAFWDKHPPSQFDLVKQNRYVFVTGTLDHALERTKEVYKRYLRSGVGNSRLIVVRGMTHRNPNGSDLDRAIQYLDAHITPEHPASRREQ